jgi:hypothetical protein
MSSVSNNTSTNPTESFYDFLARFKGMSWAEIGYILDDEEEAEQELVRTAARAAAIRKTIIERNALIAKGEYELEEGEEIETVE